ncbi:predicted protein [Nematostella vectensis]|uniref:G-protein coupled receptors family 1 profile domain-containing protein n=1 Tax=Nematostella vectensis TaxID=45351 RepID=A7RVQ0_NEMVE|nr:pyroglutamylated RF-amide peptide receptor [Nematostella vectensis]EDO44425.1 predicted protein [Nematostella vectensis]|eukprot:XP_001636488.1 predicted protein [Nematostella vectensis]
MDLNDTENLSNVSLNVPRSQCDNSRESLIIKSTALGLILVIALLGNSLVLALVRKSSQMNGAINLFVANMAISDLFVPLFVLPREMYQLTSGTISWQVRGTGGAILCKLVFFASDISPIVSVLMLCLIAIERFTAVVFPCAAALQNRRLHYVLITISWFIAVCFCAPYFYLFKLTRVGDDFYCFPDWGPAFDHVKTHQGYTTTACALFIVVPFFLLTTLYSLIVYKLKRPKVLKFLRGTSRQRRNMRTLKVIKMTMTVVIVFGICWGPFNIALLIVTFIWKWHLPTTCSFRRFWFTALFMAYSNAAINPWIYFAFIDSYRRALRETCKRLTAIATNSYSTSHSVRRNQRRVSPVACLCQNSSSADMRSTTVALITLKRMSPIHLDITDENVLESEAAT